jgi:DNA-binding transcriptional ArsR family regulator
MPAETDKPAFLADLLAAVGEPTRLRIMNLLQCQPLCVCDLQNVLGLSEPLVSRHLTRLRFAHLVTCTRDGNRMLYRLAEPDSPVRTILRRFLSAICRKEPCLKRDLERFRRLPRCVRARPRPPGPSARRESVHEQEKEISR